MLSIWIVESKSKGSRLTRAVPTLIGGTAPRIRRFRRERPFANPSSPCAPNRPEREALGPPPPPGSTVTIGSWVAAAGGCRGLRVRQPGRRARGGSSPRPTAVTGEEGGGRPVEAGERLETGDRREPDALRASEERLFAEFQVGIMN